MTSIKFDPHSSIIWVDSDPYIYASTELFRAQDWKVACFNETADALKALRKRELKPDNIKCIITSMMERGRRRERGLLNGLEMIDEIKKIWIENNLKPYPLMVINSLTADMEQCKKHSVDIVVNGDRSAVQNQVISRLKQNNHEENREK